MTLAYADHHPAIPTGLVMQVRRIQARLYAVGGLGASGFAHHSDDEGVTWQPTLWKDTVGSGPWKTQMPATGQHGLRHIWGSPRDLHLVGEYGTLLASSDGGESWTRESHKRPGCVFGFVGRGEHYYAAGDDGLLRRHKSKKTWQVLDETRDLCRIWPVGDDLIVLGDHGTVLRVDVGDGVVKLRMPVPADWYGFVAMDESRFIVVGTAGNVATTNDAGRTWEPMTTVRSRLMAVARCGEAFIAVGEKGTVLSSTNGYAWTQEASPGDVDLWGASTDEDGSVWIAGDKGRIWRATWRS